jgi:membrane protein DedA with SNARE-associated domain
MYTLSMIPHPDLKVLLETVGYIGLFAIVFAESGLFFGFFLPGDSLLFTAGLLAAAGHFKLSTVTACPPDRANSDNLEKATELLRFLIKIKE